MCTKKPLVVNYYPTRVDCANANQLNNLFIVNGLSVFFELPKGRGINLVPGVSLSPDLKAKISFAYENALRPGTKKFKRPLRTRATNRYALSACSDQ